MELDKRIAKDKTYIDCFETELAKEFIGKECYLSNDVASFANINNLYKAVLKEVDEEAINPYTLENTRWRHSSNFILPCEWVKPEEPEIPDLHLHKHVRIYDKGDLTDVEERIMKLTFDGFDTIQDGAVLNLDGQPSVLLGLGRE